MYTITFYNNKKPVETLFNTTIRDAIDFMDKYNFQWTKYRIKEK